MIYPLSPASPGQSTGPYGPYRVIHKTRPKATGGVGLRFGSRWTPTGGITVVAEVTDPELPVIWKGLSVVAVTDSQCVEHSTADCSHRETMRRIEAACTET